MRRILLAALLAASAVACFERGKKSSSRDDAAVASVGQTPQAKAAGAKGAIDAGAPAIPKLVEPSAPADPKATITVALQAEPAHLNPLLATDAVTARIAMGDIYEGLLCTDYPAGPIRPCLAERHQVSDDGKTWTFRLRQGVRWHDGRPFLAADVRFTFELLAARTVPTLLRSELDDLVSVRVSDPRTVVIRFRSRRIGRAEILSRVPILPRHVFARRARSLLTAPENRAPVGTGPLRLASWKRGVSIELVRNRTYWGVAARAARIRYRVVSSRQRALAALRLGEIDVVVQVPPAEAIAAARSPDVSLFSYALPAYLAAVHNHRNQHLRDARVRRALTLLLDRAEIAGELFAGLAPVITGPFLPETDSYDPDLRPLPFDPGRAGRLLVQATGKETVRIELMVPAGSRTMGRIADIWAADARRHVKLDIVQVPFADMLGRLRAGKFEIALMAFTTGRDVDLHHRFHSSQIGVDNYGATKDSKLDDLLEAARRAGSERWRRDRAIHRRLYELQTYTFIVADTRVGLARRGVGGIQSGGHGLRAHTLWRAITRTGAGSRKRNAPAKEARRAKQ